MAHNVYRSIVEAVREKKNENEVSDRKYRMRREWRLVDCTRTSL